MAIHSDQAISQKQFLKYAQDLAEIYELEKKRRRQLQEAYEGLITLVDAIHDGALIVDFQLEVQAANTRASEIFGLSNSAIAGRSLRTLLNDSKILDCIQTACRKDISDSPSAPIEFTAESGKIFRTTLTRLQNGWCFILLHNVTAQIRAEKLKSDFLAMISHELRTPLTGILGFAEILKDVEDLNTHDTHEALDLIKESGVRMLNTVEALLHFATLQSERLEMKNEPLQLSLLANSAIEETIQLAEMHEITLHLVHDPAETIVIQGNAAMLRDLLRQVIQNGILFGKESGSVCIRVFKMQDQACIEIEDNGIGIPPESLEKVFDSFYQEEDCLSRNRDGLGLGLSLARLIVTSHGGTISLSSSLGKGTTCHITLPVLYKTPASPDAPNMNQA